MENNNDYLMRMEGITKIFPGVKALDNVDFNLKKGEVHALVGENGAGKSTLMNILLGIHQKDQGHIYFKDKEVNYTAPSEALNSGITMIHQEISMMPNLNVAENIWIARESLFTKGFLIQKNKMRARTQELFDRLDLQIDPAVQAKSLSVAQLQLVEICRAVSYDAEIVIMDEPTSALTNSEIEILYRIIRQLTEAGVSIIFISHKLEEIFEICDRITVLRDGKFIKTCMTDEIDEGQLIGLIAGREMQDIFPERTSHVGEVVMSVRDLKREGVFSDISFDVHAGEILGFCGLMGAGRTEIVRAIFGIDQLDAGEITKDGEKLEISSPEVAIKNGIGIVTEDRLRLGCISRLSVRFNLTIANLFRYCSKIGWVNNREEISECNGMIDKMRIKVTSNKQLIAQLSGGNQQKVIVGRSLLTTPEVLILDEPTRGIDVGSKSELYGIIKELAAQGMAVIMVSSETPELVGLCDRILVVSGGRITGEFDDPDTFSQEELMRAAFSNVQ